MAAQALKDSRVGAFATDGGSVTEDDRSGIETEFVCIYWLKLDVVWNSSSMELEL